MPANHFESVTFSSQFVFITIAVHVSLLLSDERTEAEQMFLRWVSSRPLPWRLVFICFYIKDVRMLTLSPVGHSEDSVNLPVKFQWKSEMLLRGR